MTAIYLNKIDWQASVAHSDTCFKLGGTLSAAYRMGDVTSKFVNDFLSSPELTPRKKETLCRGYLFWEYVEASENFIFKSSVKLQRCDLPFKQLFNHLTDENIKFLLPLLLESVQRVKDPIHAPLYMQLLNVDNNLFRRVWKIITKGKTLPFKQLRSRICLDVRNRVNGAGFKKRFIVMSDRKLENWLQGDLTYPLLGEHPLKKGTHLKTESDYLNEIAYTVLPEDLGRVWSIMERTWPEDRMQYLGPSFLDGLRRSVVAKFPETSAVPDLISKVEQVVEPKTYLTKFIDMRVLDLSEEYSKHNPFRTWKRVEKLTRDPEQRKCESSFSPMKIIAPQLISLSKPLDKSKVSVIKLEDMSNPES